MPASLEPATTQLSELVAGTPESALSNTTPCDIPVGALLDHIQSFAAAFTAAARKDQSGPTGPPPAPDASNLGADWRTAIPHALEELTAAWDEPDAWTGMTRIGGLDMPGEAVGVVALDEVVMHSWDLARATGRPYDPDPQILEALTGFLTHMAEPEMVSARVGLFGPVVAVPPDARPLDRVVALAGRDPGWSIS